MIGWVCLIAMLSFSQNIVSLSSGNSILISNAYSEQRAAVRPASDDLEGTFSVFGVVEENSFSSETAVNSFDLGGFTLRGILMGARSHESVALIEGSGAKAAEYKEGEFIGGAKILQIAPTRVVLEESGQQHQLEFPRS